MGRGAAPAPKTSFAPQQFGMASSPIVAQSQAPEKLARQQFLSPETMSQAPYVPPQIPSYPTGGYNQKQDPNYDENGNFIGMWQR